MSRRLSVVGQIWKNLRNSLGAPVQSTHFVGQDHLGNRYFLKEADPKKNLKGGRWVEPLDTDQFKPPAVPVEWEAWLRGRRDDPPTQEEMERNHAMMLRTVQRAQELEKKHSQTDGPMLTDGEAKPWDGTVTKEDRGGSQFPVYEGMEVTPGQKNPDKS